MVRITYYMILFLSLVFTTMMYSQQLTLNQLQDLTISSRGFVVVKAPQTTSNIYIEQIGINNAINTFIDAEESAVSYQQYGDSNEIDLDVVVKKLEEQIVQFGDDNYIFERVYNPSLSSQLQVQQAGDNLTLEKYGVNSLSERMRISMQGNGRTLIIRNFK